MSIIRSVQTRAQQRAHYEVYDTIRAKEFDMVGEKVVLPRTGISAIWEEINRHYERKNDGLKMKYLAIFSLRVVSGWRLESIAQAFGLHRGRVQRIVETVRQELQDQFEIEPHDLVDRTLES